MNCSCCEKGISKDRPRICPECKHIFKGNGWDGIDAHWRAKHEDVMPYKEFWNSLCKEHKNRGCILNRKKQLEELEEKLAKAIKERDAWEGKNKSNHAMASTMVDSIRKQIQSL